MTSKRSKSRRIDDKPKPKAFVIMPFTKPFDDYYKPVFVQSLQKEGYDVERGDDMYLPRPIMDDVRNAIQRADLILCEMTTKNANVFYELGLAHAIGKPTILLSQSADEIPFDLRGIRTIIYSTAAHGWQADLRTRIRDMASRVKHDGFKPSPEPLTRTRDELGGVHMISSGASRADTFRALSEQAEHRLMILGVGMTNITRYAQDNLRSIASRVPIDFLMLDPGALKRDPAFATRLSTFLRISTFYSQIRDSFNTLRDLCRSWNKVRAHPHKMRLRVYDTIPTMSMVMIDPTKHSGECEAEFFVFQSGEFRPRLSIKKTRADKGLFELFRARFTALWDTSIPIV